MTTYKTKSTLLFSHLLKRAPRIACVIAVQLCTLAADASNYYQHTVMATTGQAGLTGIKGAPSINDLGQVAFIGQISGGESVFYAGGQTPVNLSPSYASRTFSTTVQINNSGCVVTRDSGGSIFYVRLWNVASPDSPTVVDSTSSTRQSYCTGGFNAGQPCGSSFDCADQFGNYYPCVQPPQSHYISLLFPTINNNTETAYIGGITGTTSDAVTFLGGQGSHEYLLPTSYKNMRELLLADNGRIVARAGNTTASPIWMFAPNLASYVEIASSDSGFSELGEFPGISDYGSIVAFAGNRGNGRAAFISFVGLAGSRITLRVAGENTTTPHAELGQVDANTKMFFSELDPGSRVAVKVISPQANSLENAEVLICFIATPNLAANNVPVGSQTLTFSAARGIWTIRGHLKNNRGELAFVEDSVFPVIQVGDTVGTGGTLPVDTFSIYDPLATPTISPTSLQAHYVSFLASSGNSQAVVVRSLAIKRGIDISYSACMSSATLSSAFQSFKQQGGDFVIVEGRGLGDAQRCCSCQNICAATQLSLARAAGLSVAGYCLVNFDMNDVDGGCQIRKALKAFGSEAAHLKFLAINVESGSCTPAGHSLSELAAVARIRDAAEEVVRAGLTPIIYTTTNDWKLITGNDESFGYLPLWFAYWDDFANLPAVNLGGWQVSTIKQYQTYEQSSASNPVRGYFDVDVDVADASLFSEPDPIYAFPSPKMKFNLANGHLTLFWCDEDASYILERKQGLLGSWTPVAVTSNPFLVDVSDPTVVSGAYYRLKSQ